MQHLADLEIEDIKELSENLTRREKTLREFGLSVKKFLESTPLDGGADSDLIYLTGVRIANSGIWEKVPANMMGAFLKDVPIESVSIFLEKANERYREKVINKINKFREDVKEDPLNASFVYREMVGRSILKSGAASTWAARVKDTSTEYVRVVPPLPVPVLFDAAQTQRNNVRTKK